jgi:diguanylate cyclase (GGDEF)-like protein
MRIPFNIKLGLAITLLTVGLTTVSVCYFYYFSSILVRRQVTGRLRDIGHTSTFFLTNADRTGITHFKKQLDRDSRVDAAAMRAIRPGRVLRGLDDQVLAKYDNSVEIRNLVQILRKVKLASLDPIDPIQDYYLQQFSALPDGVLAYILVETDKSPDRRVLRFLTSADPKPEPPKWPGNPTGDLYVPVSPIFRDAFKGEFQVADGYYTDEFYTCLTAVVPIKDKAGKVIAVMGLDYLAGTEQDYLKKLRSMSLMIIASSVVLSIVLSVLVARYLLSLEREKLELKNYSEDLEEMVQSRTIALQEANQSLQQLAILDSLTQIFNRRYFDDYLEAEWQRAKRAPTGLGLILCDVDHFKAYNDTYGHQAGDVCLRQVAQGLLEAIKRSEDRVTRYGGEEFAVILPNTDIDGVFQVAEAIRDQIKAMQISHATSLTDSIVTISLGVASIVPMEGDEVMQLVDLADRGLYQAKQRGRDRAEVFVEEDRVPVR